MVEEVRIEDTLSAKDREAGHATGQADLLVGIISRDRSPSVVQVVEGVTKGLSKYFPAQKSSVMVADGGWGGGSIDTFEARKGGASGALPAHRVQPAVPPGEGRAVLAILSAASRLEAQACGLVDADLVGLTPEWVERLLRPVLRAEAEYVSPAYTRTLAEGTLTTNLLAPLTGALYGKRIQQVLGGCLGLSKEVVRRLLGADVWRSDLATRGIAVWLPIEALASNCRMVEVALGRKVVAAGVRETDLAATLVQVVGPLFSLMERYQGIWRDIRGSEPLPREGDPPELLGELGEVHLDRMVRAFKLGLKDLLPVWEQIMLEETLAQLYPLGLLAADEFRFPIHLWARTISDFAVAFHERRVPRDHLLRALAPLYLGRVAAFLLEAHAMPAHRRAEMLEAIGRAFESEKESLLSRWR
ncbi:MAG TPA: glycosyl transferase family 2 [Candidatus Methylomirabilis sp.]|nr:glycosyl transferase family 2 [Candidatus Methylomirabilis sp.]